MSTQVRVLWIVLSSSLPGHIDKSSMFWHPDQPDGRGRSVAILGNNDFSHIVGGVVIDDSTINKHYHIGILLNGAALTQVRQHRSLIITSLQSSVQLGKRNNGDVQLTSKNLESTTDL